MRLDVPFNASPNRLRPTTLSDDAGFSTLKALVIARTGHHYYADKDELLFDRLRKRFKALSLQNATDYAAHLAGPDGAEEWELLEAEITIGETFFFRYAEQFAALRNVILPALIAARANERRLRIWSAGCASGAEPYSIAILLHELLGASLQDWDVSIVGTDISVAALATAQTAEYGRWALRTLSPEERLRWFRPLPADPVGMRQERFALRSEFRRMVRFERQNLLALLQGGMNRGSAIQSGAFDLILCRNVLIYFSAHHVKGIVRALSNRLGSEGWLLIGHAEPNPEFEAWLKAVSLPGTIAYRRRDDTSQAPTSATAPNAPWLTILPEPSVDADIAATDPPHRPASIILEHPETPQSTKPARVTHSSPQVPEGDALDLIRSLADAGESAEAWRRLRDALEKSPSDPLLLHYRGLLARSLGRDDEAEQAFRGALFVDKDFVMAHVQLGLLLAGRNQPIPARRALQNALRLSRAMPPEAILPESDGASAGAMVANLQLTLYALQGRDPAND